MDLTGSIKKRIGVNQDGSFMFNADSFIALDKSASTIYVSDYEESTITSMALDGNIIFQYKDDDLIEPEALLIDAGNNIIVCDRDSNNIQIILPDGKSYGALIQSKENIDSPFSIAYRESDDMLVVGCHCQDNVYVFKLA